MGLLQNGLSFMRKLRNRVKTEAKVAATQSGSTETRIEQPANEVGINPDDQKESPVYLEFVSAHEREHSITYGIRSDYGHGVCISYRSLVKDFPIPDTHDRPNCELFIGHGLIAIAPVKRQSEQSDKKTQKKFPLISCEQENYVEKKIKEAFDSMKSKKRNFHHIVLRSSQEADLCMSKSAKSVRVTDICVEVFRDPETSSRHPNCSKETYRIEQRPSFQNAFQANGQSSTGNTEYGRAMGYQVQHNRWDGKRWDYTKKEWVEDVPKPIHPTPVLLEGESVVEIPEE